MVRGDLPHIVPRTLHQGARRSAGVIRRHIGTAASEVTGHNEPDILVPPASSPHPPPTSTRRGAIRNARPFSDFLTDTFNRQHDYLRISVTERCNLRCLYCMPEEGIELAPKKELLTTPEIVYLSSVFVSQGVNKIRLTGGEPTVRKDIVPLMQQIGNLRRDGLKELALTTNGISLYRKLDAMVEAGLTGVNISLDTLDPFEFQLLTRRSGFDAVMRSINRIQEMNKLGAGVKLKINAVVMRGLNDHQILPFVEKTREEDIEVRFIEYMPFGGNRWSQNKMLPYAEMLDIIRAKYPEICRLQDARNDTSKTWQVPGFKGRVGFITSMTHNFCGTCNRLRITSDGNLKVCLHGNTEVSLRDMLRIDQDGEPMDDEAIRKLSEPARDAQQPDGTRFDRRLLQVIGAAVKRKEAAHAGMGVLENLENRPMIKIGEPIPKPNHLWSQPRPLSVHQPSRIAPGYFLTASAPGLSQARWSSSGSGSSRKSITDAASAEGTAGEQPVPPTGGASGFDFQSLTALFSSPEPRPRYSRPLQEQRKEDTAEPLTASRSVDQTLDRQERGWSTDHSQDRSRQEDSQESATRSASIDDASSRTPPASYTNEQMFGLGQAWGINQRVAHQRGTNQQDEQILERERNPIEVESGRSDRPDPIDAGAELNVKVHREAPTRPSRRTQRQRRGKLPSPGLTHVKASGQAHMVGIGEKPATRRIAVGFAVLAFRSQGTHDLVAANDMKKGDVLGAARIAGIMAAKRTSELIPLCHPLAISRVDVEISLQPKANDTLFIGNSKLGGVRIYALVESTGPTGVEMEALTAASVAALTVYDMCKAKDPYMNVAQAMMVYKSGGKSGLENFHLWRRTAEAKAYMLRHGLEVEESGSQQMARHAGGTTADEAPGETEAT